MGRPLLGILFQPGYSFSATRGDFTPVCNPYPMHVSGAALKKLDPKLPPVVAAGLQKSDRAGETDDIQYLVAL